MVNLYHRKNEIAIDLADVQNVASIDLYYSGKMYGESQLPNDWQLMSNNNRIICLSLGNSVPELILNYVGLIKIKGGSAIDRDLNIHPLNIIVEDIDYWENMTGDFDKNTQYWEGLGSQHIRDRSIKYSSIVKKNLISNTDEFYFKDGTPYQGEYHQHNDGQAMSGSEHTDESETIYRKDANGRIFDTRKGANKRQAMEIMKQIEPLVPRTRKITKSDAQKIKESQKIAHGELKEEKVKRIYTENTDPSLDSYKIGGDITGEEGTAGGTGGGGSGGY